MNHLLPLAAGVVIYLAIIAVCGLFAARVCGLAGQCSYRDGDL